jgi:hypothetical protein
VGSYPVTNIIMQGVREGFSADFHLDPNKGTDAVEKLLEKLGPEGAFDELMDQLEQNPDDLETRRQANLLVNRLEDLSSRLKTRIGH